MNHFCGIPVADRTQRLTADSDWPDAGVVPPARVRRGLRRALLGGETHYTPRPGLPELRAEITRRLEAFGFAPGGETETVITAGAREAGFVALAGARELGGGAGSRALLFPGLDDFDGVYAACQVLALRPEPMRDIPAAWPEAAVAVLSVEAAVAVLSVEVAAGVGEAPDRPLLVVDLGDRLLAGGGPAANQLPPGAVAFGSLDAAPSLAPFRVGFLHAPAGRIPVLQRWKQALSICTPAPSQRAAALRLGLEPAPPPPESARPQPVEDDDSRYSLMELAARMDGVVSLGRGDPDADAPRDAIEAACAGLNETEPLHPRGQKWLREAIAGREEARTGVRYDPEAEVLVTGGAQEGIAAAVLALVGEQEEVLLGDPFYTSYAQAIALAGGGIVPVVCGGRSRGGREDVGLGAAAAEKAASRATRPRLLVSVNFSNPTGARTGADDIRGLAALADRRHLWLLSDEVYADMALDGEGPVLSPCSLPGMRRKTLTLSSVSKSYAMTGFRVGYLTGPPDAIEACARVKAAMSGPVALFSQRAAAAALRSGDAFPAALRQIYAPRRRLLLDGLRDLGIPTAAHGGGFFVWADISGFGLPAEAFCRRLLLEARVLMFPGTAFGARWTGRARVSMLAPEDSISEALDRIGRWSAGRPRP